MNFTKKQNIIIEKLKINSKQLLVYISHLLTLEAESLKDIFAYDNELNNFSKALCTHNELLKSEEFEDIDFTVELKELIQSNLENLGDFEKVIAIRIVGELENKLLKNLTNNYERDIFMVTLCLMDNYLTENINNGTLNKNLITYKYILSLQVPYITEECINRKYDFKENLYVFPEILSQINAQDEESQFSFEEYLEQLFSFCSNELLSFGNEDYRDPNISCYA